MEGGLVGLFGQTRGWNLEDLGTWQDSTGANRPPPAATPEPWTRDVDSPPKTAQSTLGSETVRSPSLMIGPLEGSA